MMNIMVPSIRTTSFDTQSSLRCVSSSSLHSSAQIEQICVQIFWGPAALKSWLNKSWPPHINGKVIVKQWKISEIMPGMIALCATLVSFSLLHSGIQLNEALQARFVLSPDLQFQEQGGESGIQYKVSFEEYLNWLHAGVANRSPSVTSLMKFWNDQLIGGRAQNDINLSDDVLRAREALADDGEDDDFDEPGGSGEGSLSGRSTSDG
jgi:hypothetical protein